MKMSRVFGLLGALLCVCRYAGAQGDGCHSALQPQCCSLCQPGYYLPKKCGPCLPCPAKGYTDKPNSLQSCKPCRRCDGIFRYKSKCIATGNAVCGCEPGKKCANAECSQCENNPCPAGQQLHEAECQDCPAGTFNPGTEGVCKPWKDCSVIDAIVLVNGTATSDVVCVNNHHAKPAGTSAAPPTTTSIPKLVPANPSVDVVAVILTSAAFFIVLFVAVIVCLILKLEKIKNKFRPIKQTKDEDGCSCHFPEEEDGGDSEDTGSDATTVTLPAA